MGDKTGVDRRLATGRRRLLRWSKPRMSLRSTIREIKDREADLSAIAKDRIAFVAEWTSTLEMLYAGIQDMLQDLIEDRLINISTRRATVQEAEIGDYEVPELVIEIASKKILLHPVARLVSGGGRGRVDLMRDDRLSEKDRIKMMKSGADDDSWLIEKRKLGRLDLALGLNIWSEVYVPLEKGILEESIDQLLVNA